MMPDLLCFFLAGLPPKFSAYASSSGESGTIEQTETPPNKRPKVGKRPAAKDPKTPPRKEPDESSDDRDGVPGGDKDPSVKKRPSGQGSKGGSQQGQVCWKNAWV